MEQQSRPRHRQHLVGQARAQHRSRRLKGRGGQAMLGRCAGGQCGAHPLGHGAHRCSPWLPLGREQGARDVGAEGIGHGGGLCLHGIAQRGCMREHRPTRPALLLRLLRLLLLNQRGRARPGTTAARRSR